MKKIPHMLMTLLGILQCFFEVKICFIAQGCTYVQIFHIVGCLLSQTFNVHGTASTQPTSLSSTPAFQRHNSQLMAIIYYHRTALLSFYKKEKEGMSTDALLVLSKVGLLSFLTQKFQVRIQFFIEMKTCVNNTKVLLYI